MVQRSIEYAKLSLGPWAHPTSHGYVDIGQEKFEAMGKTITYSHSSKFFCFVLVILLGFTF